MRQVLPGKKLLVVLAIFLSLSSCRKDQPPAISTGVADGVGGAVFTDPFGKQFYLLPSQLKGYSVLSPEDTKNFANWCYNP